MAGTTASRPLLITIGAILVALNGNAYLIYAADAFGLMNLFDVEDNTFAGGVLVVIAVLTIIVSWGLFTLQGWGWILAILSFSIAVIGDALILFQIATGRHHVADGHRDDHRTADPRRPAVLPLHANREDGLRASLGLAAHVPAGQVRLHVGHRPMLPSARGSRVVG